MTNVLALLENIAYGKTESGKIDAFLSMRIRNPHTQGWVGFSELEDQHLTEAYLWDGELSEYTFTPLPNQQYGLAPVSQLRQPPPVGSGYGGIDLSKKYPPTVWKRAKRWLQKYGWIPAALATSGLTIAAMRRTRGKEPTKQETEQATKRFAGVVNSFKGIDDLIAWAREQDPITIRAISLIFGDLGAASGAPSYMS